MAHNNDTYTLINKFKAQVDTTSGPINGKMYPDSKADRNIGGSQSGSASGHYDGATSVSYTGIIEAVGTPYTSVINGACFRAADLITVGNHITGDVLWINFTVLEQIGAAGPLQIRVENGATGTYFEPLAAGESYTIPFNTVGIANTAFVSTQNYNEGIDELVVRICMVGP